MIRKRDRLRWSVAGAVLLAAAGLGAWAFMIGPAPVAPPELTALDPELADAVRSDLRWARVFRGSERLRMRLGMTYEANELGGLAVRTYEQVVQSSPDDAGAWRRLASAREITGDLAGAIRAQERAASLAPADASIQWRLGLWLLDTGRLDEAEERLDRALDLDPADATPWFGLARLALLRRDPAAAERIIRDEGLLAGRHAAYANQLLGSAYRQMGRPEAAEAASALGRGADPRFYDPTTERVLARRVGAAAMLSRAGALVSAGRYAEAAPLLERVRQRSAADPRVSNLLSICYIETGRQQEGLRLLEASLEADPDDVQTRLNLATAYLRTARTPQDLQDNALRHAEIAVRMQPDRATAHETRGLILARLGDAQGAVQSLKRAFDLDSRNVGLLLNAASIEQRMGRWAESITTLEKAASQDPKNSSTLLALAVAYAETGRFDEADNALLRASEAGVRDLTQLQSVSERVGVLRGRAGAGDNE